MAQQHGHRAPCIHAVQRLAIAVNALIDGLWIEGCLSAEDINEDLRIAVGIDSVQKLLNVTLPDIRLEKEAS